MYRKVDPTPQPPSNFDLPFQGKLSENNRWVIMAKLIPWSEFEGEYAEIFTSSTGVPAKSFRMALGALIIKESRNLRPRNSRTNKRKPIPTILSRHDIL